MENRGSRHECGADGASGAVDLAYKRQHWCVTRLRDLGVPSYLIAASVTV